MAEQNEKIQFDNAGSDDLIQVSVMQDDGHKRPVALIETFSEAQFELFDKLEQKSRGMSYAATGGYTI